MQTTTRLEKLIETRYDVSPMNRLMDRLMDRAMRGLTPGRSESTMADSHRAEVVLSAISDDGEGWMCDAALRGESDYDVVMFACR